MESANTRQQSEQERKNRRIGYICLALALVLTVLLVCSFMTEPRRYRNLIFFDAIVLLLLGALAQLTKKKKPLQIAIRLFVYFFVPLTAALVGVLLVGDGIVMIAKEGKGLASLLPILMGGGMLTGMTLAVLAAKHVIHPGKILRVVLGAVVLMTFYVSTTFGSFAFFADLSAHVPPQEDYDYIVAHGCGIFGDRITPLLKGRVDKALTLYRKSGKPMILSGGKGPGETITEAQAMHDYLLTQGVPEEDMILEDQSTTTRENLVNVQKMFDTDGQKHSYVCVTSDYHVFRTSMLARYIGLDMQGVGSKTALYYWPSAMIREYSAVMQLCWPLNLALWLLFFFIAMRARPETWTDKKIAEKKRQLGFHVSNEETVSH